ncbi:MAG TPA: hypothetical protein VMV16_00725 [Solirubrobacteraceae bacterium]|nr:hypothetical protein [Solirubrobacteraceae bacterium]
MWEWSHHPQTDSTAARRESPQASDLITFLATPSAGYTNDAIIPVDGGRPAI